MQQEQEQASVEFIAARWLLLSQTSGGVPQLPIADEELEAIKEQLAT